jgi:hypothetical protein
VNSVITITGIGDHLQPEWLITFTGIRNPYRETYEEMRVRRRLEDAFGGAFHNYAKQYTYIAVPNYANCLNAYRLDIGYQLNLRANPECSRDAPAGWKSKYRPPGRRY